MITMPIEGGLRVKLSIWSVCYGLETSLVQHAIGMRACLIALTIRNVIPVLTSIACDGSSSEAIQRHKMGNVSSLCVCLDPGVRKGGESRCVLKHNRFTCDILAHFL